jgi:hypothetical protein
MGHHMLLMLLRAETMPGTITRSIVPSSAVTSGTITDADVHSRAERVLIIGIGTW